MVAPKDAGDARRPASTSDSDVDYAGWDPYIVSITGGTPAETDAMTTVTDDSSESRKVRVMAWLRDHGA